MIYEYSELRRGTQACLNKKRNVFASSAAEKHYRPSLELEPVHKTIKLTFDIENKKLAGTVEITLKRNALEANTIKFNGIDFSIHKITSINQEGESLVLDWNYDGQIHCVLFYHFELVLIVKYVP